MNKYIFFRQENHYSSSSALTKIIEIDAVSFSEAWWKLENMNLHADFVWEQKEDIKFIPGIMSPIPFQVSHH